MCRHLDPGRAAAGGTRERDGRLEDASDYIDAIKHNSMISMMNDNDTIMYNNISIIVIDISFMTIIVVIIIISVIFIIIIIIIIIVIITRGLPPALPAAHPAKPLADCIVA